MELATSAALVGTALAGVLMGAVAGAVPGLHVYNMAGAALLLFSRGALDLSGDAFAFLLLGMAVGWCFASLVPAVFLFAPDESSAHSVLPASKLVLRGAGMQALLIMSLSALMAVLMLALLAPFAETLLRPARAIIAPHAGWMLLAIIAFILLGEWPRGRTLGQAWAGLGGGLLVFALSGLIGMVLMLRSPVAIESAFQNLLPAFTGLFVVPSLLAAAWLGRRTPAQTGAVMEMPAATLLRGAATGVLGGLFASFLPVVSGGVGGLLAGHATAQRGDALFLASQGASRTAYLLGSILLLFVPGVGLTRGGLAWMLSSVYLPYGPRLYALAVCALCLCAALAFVLCWVMGLCAARFVPQLNMRAVALCSLVITVSMTGIFTGAGGLLVALVCTPVGLIPITMGTRRMNALGVILLPITLGMNGWLVPVARVFGLI